VKVERLVNDLVVRGVLGDYWYDGDTSVVEAEDELKVAGALLEFLKAEHGQV
jgi:hypothetical protein